MTHEEGSVEHDEAGKETAEDDVNPGFARLTMAGTRAMALAGLVALAINESGITRTSTTFAQ